MQLLTEHFDELASGIGERQREGLLLGFFQGLGVRAEARRLQPFLRADEHFSECDVCDVPVIAWRDGPRQAYGQAVVSLTSHAIYLRPAKSGGVDLLRIPYARVVDVQGAAEMVEVVTKQCNILIRDIGRAMISDKFGSISAHIGRLHRHSQTIEVPGGSVHAICRPFDEDQAPEWMLIPSEGVDIENPAVKDALGEQLATPIEKYGPLHL